MTFEYSEKELLDKYKLALLLSAAGDSLGWPHEFAWKKPEKPLDTFMKWEKVVGGKWWGYKDVINPGDYSDDTQLTISVARSIDTSGRFFPEYFAYLELPLWLNYERGGGGSIKAASRNILKKTTEWFTNFYKTDRYDYRNAGANGAAMRTLPIALVNIENEERFIIDTFKNSIITHGHPRAIIGSILIGGTQIFFLRHREIDFFDLKNYIHHLLSSSFDIARKDTGISRWLALHNSNSAFEKSYENTIGEAQYFINKIEKYLSRRDEEYYQMTKALSRNFKGSGISTVSCAIYLVLKYIEEPETALLNAVNMIGSDTDTIASFVGSLLGISDSDILGSKRMRKLILQLQDREYFEIVGRYLWETNFGEHNLRETGTIDKTDAFLKLMAWEIGLHEMFWEALTKGDVIIHPTLGRGIIENKREETMRRDDYIAKIIKIKFFTGQTAYFHSRVSKDESVRESLGRELAKALS